MSGPGARTFDGLVERPLALTDIEDGILLSTEPGWNQIAADWRLMIGQEMAWGMAAEDGHLVASGLAVPYGERFAWIAMILVTAAHRRRGIATHMMRRCIDSLDARGLIAGLDATPDGRQVYLPLGFKDIYTITRLYAERLVMPEAPSDENIRRMTEADLDAVAAYDREPFGADRRTVLEDLRVRMPGSAFVHETAGRIDGYVLARDGRVSPQVGPLVADEPGVARTLAAHALATVEGPVCLDVGDHHTDLIDWLEELGFMPQFPFIRMILGRSEPLDQPERIFVIAGPELG